MSFRDNLREALDFSGMEQKELAYKANTSLRNIENYLRENGSIPAADKAVKIAQALGVTVEYLVTGKDSNTNAKPPIDPEIQKLIKQLIKLPKNMQQIVIKNTLNLTEILMQQL